MCATGMGVRLRIFAQAGPDTRYGPVYRYADLTCRVKSFPSALIETAQV